MIWENILYKDDDEKLHKNLCTLEKLKINEYVKKSILRKTEKVKLNSQKKKDKAAINETEKTHQRIIKTQTAKALARVTT